MLELDLQLDDDPLTGMALVQHLPATLDQQGLPVPPIPDRLIPAMRDLGGLRYGTRDLVFPLSDLPAWQAEWLDKPVPDYMLFGVEGRGAVSRCLHYHLVCGPLAVFVQHRLAGPDTDRPAGRMRALFGTLPGLLVRLAAAQQSGWLGEHEAVLWVDSDLQDSGWARLRHGDPPRWQIGHPAEALAEAFPSLPFTTHFG